MRTPNQGARSVPCKTAQHGCARQAELAAFFVTVYRAIMGYGRRGKVHHESTLGISHDRPILLSIIDKEEKLRVLLPLLDEMIQQGLVVLSDVDVITSTRMTIWARIGAARCVHET